MRHLTRLPLAIATIAALNLGGAAALAESPTPFPALPGEIVLDVPCNPVEELCADPEPDPELNPAIPPGPGDITTDPCDPVEQFCGDPDPDPGIPEGPGDFTADPCDPVEQSCGGDPEPEPEPTPDPEPEPCALDDVCTRTPTFTG